MTYCQVHVLVFFNLKLTFKFGVYWNCTGFKEFEKFEWRINNTRLIFHYTYRLTECNIHVHVCHLQSIKLITGRHLIF